jgi:predicted nucleic acid-binding protein
VSELRRPACDAWVAEWFASVSGDDLYLSVLVVGEIRRGIERLARRDPEQAAVFAAWLDDLRVAFADRILPIDAEVAERWGAIDAVTPVPVEDGLMAATAIAGDLVFVTRNVTHVDRSGARLLNPWSQ